MFSFGLAVVLLLAPPPLSAPNPPRPAKPPTTQKKGEKTKVLREVVVVTATKLEQPLGEAVALVSVVSAEELARSPALVLDDHLRRIPGFSLFRRSSSLVAHPTSQGVSLRGIGPSGASRSLVLFDGIPLNDPFGGWVYWNRIPLGALERIEVVRGATSQLYGSSALAGAIQLLPRRPVADTLEARGQIGNRQTYDLELLAADRSGEWGYLVSGHLFETDGFSLVDESERGPVDVRARSEFQSFFGRTYYKKFHAGVNLFGEGRGNGTRLQTNSTHLYLLETGITEDAWQGNFYSQWGLFKNSFSRTLPDRSAEFLTARQRVSSLGQGGSFTWRPGRRFLLGTDWRRVSWDRHEQNLAGVFAQDLIALHRRLDLLVGVRLDVWKSGRTRSVVNPRVGLLYRASDALTLRGSAYGGFRAPTLNELFRPFRVGNVRTRANPNLEEERLWGTELGADLHPARSVLVRLNGFWNSLRDPVSNVTLSIAPEGILRQRQNLGRATIKGLEAETIVSWGYRWRLRSAYLYSDARVAGSALRLPQVPRHQGSLEITYAGPLTVRAEGRYVGSQFEDDRNQLKLGGYPLFNLALRRPVSEHIELFLGLENVLDRDYAVGRLPIERLGTPRLIHAGLSFRFAR